MNAQFHTVEPYESLVLPDWDEAITDYAAGNLSPAKHAIIACLVELNPKAAKKSAFETDVAATLMAATQEVPLSLFFIEETLAKLPYCASILKAANDCSKPGPTPKPLRDLMDGQGLRDIVWKSFIPGVAIHNVLGDRRTRFGERLYLLRIKGGMPMPEHSHIGEEWALILKGGYMSEGQHYARGDLHFADATMVHSPKIDIGEDCICLVMTEGPLKMKNWLTKIIQKLVGI